MKKFEKSLLVGVVFVSCLSGSFCATPSAKNITVGKNNLPKDTAAFNKVKGMYAEFIKLIETGVSEAEMTKFFDSHFDVEKITEKFTGSKKADASLTQSLINYFKFLLNGEIIKQVKDYQLSEEFSQISKKNSIIMLCKLSSKDTKSSGSVLDMSVNLSAHSSKVLELSFMKSIYLIKGAKNIVDLHCQEKAINYKSLKTPDKIKTCVDALNAYVVKQSATAK